MSSKPRLTKNEWRRVNAMNRSLKQKAKQPQKKPGKMTLKQSFAYLVDVIRFRLGKKYLNHRVLYMGKYRMITGETRTHFMCSEYPKIAFPKKNNKFKIK